MSDRDSQAGEGKPRWTGASIALFIIGLLIFLPAVGCTILIASEEADNSEAVLTALVIGALPIALGAGLIYAAMKIRPRDDMSSEATPPRWTGAAIALLILGLLILLPSGLCTVVVGGSIIIEGLPYGDLSGIPIVLIYGGVPVAMGAVLVWGALKARRRV